MSKAKETYRETYKAGAAVIRKDLLPERLPYMGESFVVDAMELRAAGCLDDGREFQDIRVYTRERPGRTAQEPES